MSSITRRASAKLSTLLSRTADPAAEPGRVLTYSKLDSQDGGATTVVVVVVELF